MVKATIEIEEEKNRILDIIKGRHGFRNKTDAINFLIERYEKDLEPELRPEYLEKLIKVKKNKGIPFKNIEELRKLTGE